MISQPRHLSDDQLLHLTLYDDAGSIERRHLVACESCERRRMDLAQLVDECATAGIEEADAAFPVERLTRQQARILQRIDHEGRPARVLAFPGHHDVPAPRTRPAMRWIAGAAAAGLVIGVVTGHLVHDLSEPANPVAASTAAARVEVPGSPSTAPAPLNEEELLGRIERAAQRSAGPALRPLDDLTPLVWEVAAR